MRYCNNCGKKIVKEAKFCGDCGEKINFKYANEKIISTGFFDLSPKKNLLQASIIIILITISILESYLYIPDEDQLFFFTVGIIFLGIQLIISAYKGFSKHSLLLSFVGTTIAIISGGLFAVPLLIWELMTPPSRKISNITLIKRMIISKYSQSGIVWMTIGAIVTLGTFLLSSEDGTYYIMYGATIVGAYYLVRGAFHAVFPTTLDKKEEQIAKEITEEIEKKGFLK